MTSFVLATAAATFTAYFVNALTAFGGNIIFIPIAALILEPKEAVVVCAGLNMFANILLVKVDKKAVPRSYWFIPVICFTSGTVLGALTLKTSPEDSFTLLLGIVIATLGVWFLMGRPMGKRADIRDEIPERSTPADWAVSAFSGFCGGSVGINGPPLVWHFGRIFAKEAFRKVLVLLFLPAAFLQFATYSAVGLVDSKTILFILVCLPFMWIGTLLGNRAFFKVNLPWFNRIVGMLLIAISTKFIFVGIA